MKKRLLTILLFMLVLCFSIVANVWESYTSVWGGVFSGTEEAGDGDVVLSSGLNNGSLSTNGFSGDENVCLAAGCNRTLAEWSANGSSGDHLAGQWRTYDAHDDSNINTDLWTTWAAGGGSVTEDTEKGNAFCNTDNDNAWWFSKGFFTENRSIRLHTVDSVGGRIGMGVTTTATTGSQTRFSGAGSSNPWIVDLIWDSPSSVVLYINGVAEETFTGLNSSWYLMWGCETEAAQSGWKMQVNETEVRDGETWVELDVCFSMDNITFDTCYSNVSVSEILINNTALYSNWTAFFNRTVIAEPSAELRSVNVTYSVNSMVLQHSNEPVVPVLGGSVVLWGNVSENSFAETCNFSASHLYDNITTDEYSGDMFLINENASSNADGVWNITILEANKTGNIEANITCNNSFGGSQTFNYSFPIGDTVIPELNIDVPVNGDTYTVQTVELNISTYDFGIIDDAVYRWGGPDCASGLLTDGVGIGCNSASNHSDNMADWQCESYDRCQTNATFLTNGTAGNNEDLSVWVYIADISGNFNESSVNFTVSVPSPPTPPSPGGGGGGGGGGSPKCPEGELYDTKLGVCVRRIPENITNLTLAPFTIQTLFPYIPFSKKYRALNYSVKSNWELKSVSITKGNHKYDLSIIGNTTVLIQKKFEEENFVAKTETIEFQVIDVYGRTAFKKATFTIINVGVYIPLPFKPKTGKFLEPFFAFEKKRIVGIRVLLVLTSILTYVTIQRFIRHKPLFKKEWITKWLKK